MESLNGDLLHTIDRDALRGSFIGVVIGLAILGIGIYWFRIGKVWDNIYGWSSRTEEPVIFWVELISVILIGCSLFLSYGFKIAKIVF
jgi:hypothetical protein